MRTSRRPLLYLAAAVALGGAARAQDLQGEWMNDDCTQLAPAHPCGWVASLKMGGIERDDWIFDLASAPGGALVGFQPGDIQGNAFTIRGTAFTNTPQTTDHVAILAVGCFDQVAIDTATLGLGGFIGFTSYQLVGDSPSLPGSIGLTLPTDGSIYTVNTPSGPRGFPMTTMSGRIIAFAPLADLSDAGPGACTTGGAAPEPALTGPPKGWIRGYNIFRRAGSQSSPPSEDQILSSWLEFIDIDTFDQSGVVPDQDPNDLAYFNNADGLPRTGDEIVLFADVQTFPNGNGRANAPWQGQGYWYAIQAVLRGSLLDFANASLAGAPPQDYRVDVDADTIPDGVDVDGDGILEFWSPQAEMGLPGLGIVGGHRGPSCLPRRPRMIFSSGDFSQLPAEGMPSFSARAEGRDVVLTIDLANSGGEITAIQAWRRRGAARQHVTTSPLRPPEGEGSAIVVRDSGVLNCRGCAAPAYEIELRLEDGSSTWLGPLSPEIPDEPRGRRVR